MRVLSTIRRATDLFVFVIALQLAGMGSASASVISSSPTLPLLDVPYMSAVGAGCFPAVALCIEPGTLTLTSVVSSMFDALGQDIVTTATYGGVLTNLSHVPIGTIALSGSVEQEILGRTTATQTGTWATELVALLLTGPVLGHTLTVELASSPPSIGGASIIPLGDGDPGGSFRIDSFFDVFVDLTLDTPVPLHAERGPLRFVALQVPEPTGVMLLGAAMLGLVLTRRRRT